MKFSICEILGVTIIDPITHGLIGAALSRLSGNPLELTDPILIGCTLGAMLPDLDIVTHVKGRVNYLLQHRGASHSLLALGSMALALGTVVYYVFPTSPWLTVVFWTLVGTLSHGLADLLNSYGAQLLWPFNKKKFTINMAMLTEPVIFLLFLGSLVVSIWQPDFAFRSTIITLFLSAVYLLLREYHRDRTKKKLVSYFNLTDKENVKVLPAMYRPFSWAFIIYYPDRVKVGVMSREGAQILQVLPQWDKDDPVISKAMAGEIAEIFNKLTPHLHIIRTESDSEVKVEFVDLRYLSKKSFIYTGEVYFQPDGNIAREKFYPLGRENSQGVLFEY